MKKSTISNLFDALSRKIISCFLTKSTASKENKIPNHAFNQTKHENYLSHSFKFYLFLFFILVSSKSFAQTWPPVAPVNPPTGGFRIEGDVKANFPIADEGDWITNGISGNGDHVIKLENSNWVPVNSNTTKFVQDSFNNTSDLIFSGSSFSDNPTTVPGLNGGWKWTTGKATNKCDINNAMYHVTTSANNKWIILGGDRFTTTGTSYIDFEFLQNTLTRNSDGTFTSLSSNTTGGRKVGDFVLSMEYSNGGTNANVHYYRWENSNGYKYVEHPIPVLNNTTLAYGATNGAATDAPYSAFGSLNYIPYAFVEAAVNIDAILGANCDGLTIKTIFVKTKASDSYNAALKDFVEPQQVNFQFGSTGLAYSAESFCKTGGIISPTPPPSISGGNYSYIPLTSHLELNENTGAINLGLSDAGTYTVTYNYTSSGCPFPASATVTVVANPVALALTGSSICASAPNTGTISSDTSGNNTISYQLYNSSDTPVQSAKLGTGSALNWTALAVGNGYYVKAIGAAPTSCTTNSNAVNVISVTNPTALVLTGSSICSSAPNTSTISSSTSGSNTISYQLYNSSNATVQTAKLGTGAALTWTTLAVGDGYYVVATGASPTSCTTTSNIVNTTSVNNPTALVLTGSSICSSAPGTATISSSTSGNNTISYQLYNSSNATVQTAKLGTGAVLNWTGLTVGNGYYVIATGANPNNCTSTSNTVNATQIANPAAPTICVVQPSLCGPAVGSITVTAPLDGGGIDYEYSINNGTSWVDGTTFSNLSAGSVTGVKVRIKGTQCESAVANCDASNCEPQKTVAPIETSIPNKTDNVGFDAYPVPFKDLLNIKYKFDYKTDVKIEIFDLRGVLILSKTDTDSYFDKEIMLELNFNFNKEQIYIVKVTTNRGSSVKKVISSK